MQDEVEAEKLKLSDGEVELKKLESERAEVDRERATLMQSRARLELDVKDMEEKVGVG